MTAISQGTSYFSQKGINVFKSVIFFSCMIYFQVCQVNSKTVHVKRNQGHCASIQLYNSSIPEVRLSENTLVNRSDFENIQKDKLENALFFVGENTTTPSNCILEICGFSMDGDDPYLYGTCEWYKETENGEPIEAPSNIYGTYYEVTSVGCACNADSSGACKNATCTSENDSYTWQDSECAIMYQEDQCQSCYFTPIKLDNQTQFCASNSYHIKSMIIRPDCRVERTILGELWWSWGDLVYTNYTGVVDIDTLQPNFHEDSANFTCFCPEIGLVQTLSLPV